MQPDQSDGSAAGRGVESALQATMRERLYVLLPALWVTALAGCLSAPSEEAWLAVGFRSPEQTFASFQTGLRAELPDLEYRCLSGAMKRDQRVSQTGYREFRSELFGARPWLKLAAKAEVVRREELGPGRVRLHAEVDTWFQDVEFAVDFVREDYYELYVGSERVADDLADWQRIVRERGDDLDVRVPRPADRSLEELSEIRAGREWKIDGFPLAPADR